MTLFHLIRHGNYGLLDRALGGRDDHGLDDTGRAQAARVADALAGRGVAAVISSPVRRAMETAQPVAERLGVPVIADEAFAEIDFGPWTGRSFGSLRDDRAWQAWNSFRSTVRVPQGEAMLDVQARAVGGIRSLAERWPGQDVAVITHGDIIKAILCHSLGAPLDHLHRIDIGAGSISQMGLFDADIRVLGVNLAP